MNNMSRYIKSLFIVIALCVLTVIGYKTVENSPEAKEIKTEVVDNKEYVTVSYGDNLIDINSATVEELDSLPNIGPKRAEAIIDMRNEMHGFYTVNDLLCVDGIGEKTLDKIRSVITVRKYKN